jgi:hypothetical protein
MPAISLVVCVHKERDLLERLLRETCGLFDDLVVVHDGPELASDVATPTQIREKPPEIDYSELSAGSPLPAGYTTPTSSLKCGTIHELVAHFGGQYFQGPRSFQQEPHWPFAWSRAKHDWILRLDADEFPSVELKGWLTNFRTKQDVDPAISGFTCIWPVWSGTKAVTRRWPAGRNFLFHRHQVHFFGMVEQVPIADNHYEFLPLILCHQPRRKSHGLANILFRGQGKSWRTVIAQSLLGRPQDLPQWRWGDRPWPPFWQRLQNSPTRAGLYFLVRNTFSTLRDQWQTEGKIMPCIAVATPLHHLLIGLLLRRLRRARSGDGLIGEDLSRSY